MFFTRTRVEWKFAVSSLLGGDRRGGRVKMRRSNRKPDRFETRIDRKRVEVKALTASEARAQLKKAYGLKTTAGLMVVNKSR